MAQNIFYPDAWTRAKNRFIEDLTIEEQVCTCQSDSLLLGVRLERSDLLCEQSPVASLPLISHLGCPWIVIGKAHSAASSDSYVRQIPSLTSF